MDSILPSIISCVGSVIAAVIAAAATIIVSRGGKESRAEGEKKVAAVEQPVPVTQKEIKEDSLRRTPFDEAKSSRVWAIASLLIGLLFTCVTVSSPAIIFPLLAIVFGVVGIFIRKNWAGMVGLTLNGLSVFIASGIAVSNIMTNYSSLPVSTITSAPSPTLTVTPTFAPTLTVEEQSAELLKFASQTWKLRILDTFDVNNYDWPTGERLTGDQKDLAKVSVNGKYYVDIQTADGGGWWLLSDINAPNEFYLKTDARRTTQQPGCIMSLAWETTNGYYLYEIFDNEKQYRLEVYDRTLAEEDKWRDAIQKTPTDLILSQDVNQLAVINDAEYIWLFLNDRYLSRVENEYAAAGDVGFYVSVCNDNSQVTFEFDNFELRTP